MEIQSVIQNIVTEVPKRARKLVSASLPAPLERDTFQKRAQLLSTVPKKVKKNTLDSLIQIFSAKKYEDFFQDIPVDEYLMSIVKTENDASILKLLLKKNYFKYGFNMDSVEIILKKSRDNKYKDIVLDLCKSKKCVIPDFHETNESLFDRLYVMKNNNFEKYKKVVNSKNLLNFFERDITWDTGCISGGKIEPFLKTSLLEDLDISEFSNIEKIYNKFYKHNINETLECNPHKLTYLYFKKPKIYDYLIKHQYLLKEFPDTVYEVPSVEILEEINKSYSNHIANRCSSVFENYVEWNVRQLTKYQEQCLEKMKLSNDIILYRGDSNKLFESISINNSALAKIVKETIKNNPDIALKEQVFSNGNKQYLYDYIITKKDLTLSDAMNLVSAGYKDEKLIRSIENAIKHSSIVDKKRKSLTLSKAVAEGYGDSTFSKLTIKKGTECAFIGDNGGQREFLLSSKPRKITFTNAIFDPEIKKFKLEATVEPVNN